MDTTDTKPARRVREKRFSFPVSDTIMNIREGTLRRSVADALSGIDGASFSEIEDLVRKFDQHRGVESKNVERRAYEVIRLLHYQLGYGLHQQGDRIHLIGQPTQKGQN